MNNDYVLLVLSAFLGSIATLSVQQITNRRRLFTYTVSHNRVGVSADDDVFGKVRVTLNEKPVANLYASSIEIVNESSRDFEDVLLHVYAGKTHLLGERTSLVDTTQILEWSPNYAAQLKVAEGAELSAEQIETYHGGREYTAPLFSRGQRVRLSFLCVAEPSEEPRIYLEILHKGVVLKRRHPVPQIFGVPQPLSALVGIGLCIPFLLLVISTIETVWVASSAALLFGCFAVVPGAGTIRAARWIRGWFLG